MLIAVIIYSVFYPIVCSEGEKYETTYYGNFFFWAYVTTFIIVMYYSRAEYLFVNEKFSHLQNNPAKKVLII